MHPNLVHVDGHWRLPLLWCVGTWGIVSQSVRTVAKYPSSLTSTSNLDFFWPFQTLYLNRESYLIISGPSFMSTSREAKKYIPRDSSSTCNLRQIV